MRASGMPCQTNCQVGNSTNMCGLPAEYPEIEELYETFHCLHRITHQKKNTAKKIKKVQDRLLRNSTDLVLLQLQSRNELLSYSMLANILLLLSFLNGSLAKLDVRLENSESCRFRYYGNIKSRWEGHMFRMPVSKQTASRSPWGCWWQGWGLPQQSFIDKITSRGTQYGPQVTCAHQKESLAPKINCVDLNKQPFRLGTGGDWGFRGGDWGLVYVSLSF